MKYINKLFNINPLREKIIIYTNKNKKDGIIKKIKLSINNKIKCIGDIFDTLMLKLIVLIFRIY